MREAPCALSPGLVGGDLAVVHVIAKAARQWAEALPHGSEVILPVALGSAEAVVSDQARTDPRASCLRVKAVMPWTVVGCIRLRASKLTRIDKLVIELRLLRLVSKSRAVEALGGLLEAGSGAGAVRILQGLTSLAKAARPIRYLLINLLSQPRVELLHLAQALPQVAGVSVPLLNLCLRSSCLLFELRRLQRLLLEGSRQAGLARDQLLDRLPQAVQGVLLYQAAF